MHLDPEKRGPGDLEVAYAAPEEKYSTYEETDSVDAESDHSALGGSNPRLE